MDDVIEIDLRKLFRNLIHNWKIIIGISFVFGVAAFLYSFLQPDIYQAKAVIVITKPRYIANFDDQYQTLNPGSPSNKALIDIIHGDSIISDVYNYWESDQKELVKYNNFKENITELTAGNDPSILVLKINMKNPDEAALLVNYWANVSVYKINALYSGADDVQLAFFDDQIQVSLGILEKLQESIELFDARDNTELIRNELNSLLSTQSNNLRKQRIIENTRKDALSISQTLNKLSNTDSVDNQLIQNFQILQLRYYSNTGFEQTPLQFQISADSQPNNISAQLLKNQINTWLETLDSQLKELMDESDLVDAEVLAYQEEIRKLSNERENLFLEYNVVKETYQTLLRKQKEVRISSQEPHGDVQIASYARTPEERLPHNTVRNTAIALIAGGILAVIFVILRDWFKQENPE